METKESLIEPLLEKAERYSKTSFELLKLRSVDKTADVTSSFLSRLILAVVLLLFTLTLSTATALWLGEVLGKNYYGFLIVASFYALVGIVLLLVHPRIKLSINNLIITQFLN